jgi:hypothetical protein
MATPSLATRLADLQRELDRLQRWSSKLPAQKNWVQQLNELRFVRATLVWEEFLEQSFICFLRGARSIQGRIYPLQVALPSNLAAAEAAAIGHAAYGKWLNERWTLARAGAIFTGSHPFLPLTSPVFPEIRAVRNRIVHRSEDARREFQNIVTLLYGTWRPGMTPGRLLSEPAGSPRVDHYLQVMRTTATLIAS